MKKGIKILIILVLVAILGCMVWFVYNDYTQPTNTTSTNTATSSSTNSTTTSTTKTTPTANQEIYKQADQFTERDLEQTVDTSTASGTYTVSDGNDVHIVKEGIYVLTGTASNSTIYVEADDTAKVQLVLDGLNITNDSFPAIYVKTADKVFITTISESRLMVTGSFKADGDTNTDGVIFSKQDITFNGTGTLTIDSTNNGIVGKDDVKFTGGTYNITAKSKSVEANDSIRISDGTFSLAASTDGLHAENDDDASLGYIYISGGTFTIKAGDDAIHAQTVVQIDGGTFDITAAEGIEATYVQINDGTINISASDDGINAGAKSNAYTVGVEFNGGTTTITMGQGDTDGVDSNGNITVNGGTINITGQSSFDYDGTATFNGGTIIVNGEEVDTIPDQMLGNPGMGGFQQGGGMQKQ